MSYADKHPSGRKINDKKAMGSLFKTFFKFHKIFKMVTDQCDMRIRPQRKINDEKGI